MPSPKRFTARYVREVLPILKRAKVYTDPSSPGLCVRISPGGARTWFYRYKHRGRLRAVTIGDALTMTPTQARDVWFGLRRQVQDGKDPAGERAKKRQAQRAAEVKTVADLVDLYVERYARPSQVSWRDTESALRRHVVPRWGRMRPSEVTRHDARDLVADLHADGVGGHRIVAIARTMWNWGIAEQLVEANPFHLVKNSAPKRAKKRALSFVELGRMLPALEDEPMDPEVRDVLVMALLCGLRAGDLCGLRWDHIDLDGQVLQIPNTKAGREGAERGHVVPITPAVAAVLLRARGRTGPDGYVFPRHGTDQRMRSNRVSHVLGELRQPDGTVFGVEWFTCHDLKRTCGTRLAEMGVPPHVRDKVLNHSSGGPAVREVYDRWDYLQERRDALAAFHARLAGVCGGALPWSAVA